MFRNTLFNLRQSHRMVLGKWQTPNKSHLVSSTPQALGSTALHGGHFHCWTPPPMTTTYPHNHLKIQAMILPLRSKEMKVKGLVKSDTLEGTSLVVHWLRISLAMQGTQVQTLVRELKSHRPQSPRATTWESVYLSKRSHSLRVCAPQ